MELGVFSFGIGDRFGQQGRAQLDALIKAEAAGVLIVPVWNKSNREHQIVGTTPDAVRTEAEAAVSDREWRHAWHVDADHIQLANVDAFIPSSDFFTIDVADVIGEPTSSEAIDAFVEAMEPYTGQLVIPGLATPLTVTNEDVRAIACTFLGAVQEAGRLYRHIATAKGAGAFVTEVSMDETDIPQTPIDLFFILAALAREGVPVQTLAPKFSGRFNKGVDYIGDTTVFSEEFEADVCVLNHAVGVFGLPAGLKLSVHSGSDKFSIYPCIADVLNRHKAGLHLKTAGTTWLAELIGLAEAGGEGLHMAKTIYRESWTRFDALCAPYAAVIDIDREALPSPDTVDEWNGARYAAALRHEATCPDYDPNLRQLLHVGYKVAAEMGDRYIEALQAYESHIARNVTANLFENHIRPLFLGAR